MKYRPFFSLFEKLLPKNLRKESTSLIANRSYCCSRCRHSLFFSKILTSILMMMIIIIIITMIGAVVVILFMAIIIIIITFKGGSSRSGMMVPIVAIKSRYGQINRYP